MLANEQYANLIQAIGKASLGADDKMVGVNWSIAGGSDIDIVHHPFPK
jgi:hypothetical protein